MAGPFKIASLAIFVPKKDTLYFAGFCYNGIANINLGAEAEI
jgi:hypothetical protein